MRVAPPPAEPNLESDHRRHAVVEQRIAELKSAFRAHVLRCCISPGPTETEGAGAALWPTEEDRRRVLDSVPAGRFTTPVKVAESAAFLLDNRQAAYVTGDVLSVDGGQWLGKAVYADSSQEGGERRRPR